MVDWFVSVWSHLYKQSKILKTQSMYTIIIQLLTLALQQYHSGRNIEFAFYWEGVGMATVNFQHIEAHKYYHKISIQEIFQKNNLKHLLKVPYVECAINGMKITDIHDGWYQYLLTFLTLIPIVYNVMATWDRVGQPIHTQPQTVTTMYKVSLMIECIEVTSYTRIWPVMITWTITHEIKWYSYLKHSCSRNSPSVMSLAM